MLETTWNITGLFKMNNEKYYESLEPPTYEEALNGLERLYPTYEEALKELERLYALPSIDKMRAKAIIAQQCAGLARRGEQEAAKTIMEAFDQYTMHEKRTSE